MVLGEVALPPLGCCGGPMGTWVSWVPPCTHCPMVWGAPWPEPCSLCARVGLWLGCAWALGGTCKETTPRAPGCRARASPTGPQHPVLCHSVPRCARGKQPVGAPGLPLPVGNFIKKA